MTLAVNIAQGGSNNVTFRNKLINGGMVIDQRNAGASVTANDGTYDVDRWKCVATANGKFTMQQNAGSVTPPAGFSYYLGCTSTSAYSVSATDFFHVRQAIEGFNVADLGFGTANAQTVTLSFWVRSSLTGTFGGSLNNNAFNRSYPFSYTISSANTWEQKSVTIAGDTSGTWLTTNGVGFNMSFSLGAGSTQSGTAGAWVASEKESVTGATSVVGTNGATFYITGVQLEAGSTASPFEYRQYGTELALCQRYFYKVTGSSGNGYAMIGSGSSTSTTVAELLCPVPVTMRTIPSASYSGTLTAQNGVTAANITSINAVYGGYSSMYVSVAVASGLTVGQGAFLYTQNATSNSFSFSAEL